MERYEIVVDDEGNYCGLIPSENGPVVQHADAQATIAALQARVRELEQWVQDQSTANLETMRHVDEMQSRAMEAEQQLTQRTAELEAIEKILDINSGKTTVEKVRDLHHSFKQVWESYQDASNEMFKAQAELEAREVDVVTLREDLEQRTAELEAAKADKAKWEDIAGLRFAGDHKFVKEMELLKVENANLQAELERVSLLSSHNERRFEEVDKKYKELRTLILTLPKVEGEIVAQAGYVKDRNKVYACFGSNADMTAYAAIVQHRQGMEG